MEPPQRQRQQQRHQQHRLPPNLNPHVSNYPNINQSANIEPCKRRRNRVVLRGYARQAVDDQEKNTMTKLFLVG